MRPDPSTAPEELRANWTASLLQALTPQSELHARALVTRGMAELDAAPRSTNVVRVTRFRLRLALRAAILFVAIVGLIFVVQKTPAVSAAAIVTRSLERSLENVGRHYVAQNTTRLGTRSIEVRADVYTKGPNQLAIRIQLPFLPQPLWFGRSGNDAWLVPPRGPVFVGDAEDLDHWSDDDLSPRDLQLPDMLSKLRNSYSLVALPDETLETADGPRRTLRVRGERSRSATSRHPDRIEVWIDAESGLALKIVADWILAEGESGRESLIVEYKESTELDETFFTPEAHGAGDRIRQPFPHTGRRR